MDFAGVGHDAAIVEGGRTVNNEIFVSFRSHLDVEERLRRKRDNRASRVCKDG